MIEQARRFIVLAHADELVESPMALAGYTSVFRETDDATLVLYAPDRTPEQAGRVVERALAMAGVPEGGGPDMLLVAAPGTPQLEAELRDRASAVYSPRAARAPFEHLPHFTLADVARLRAASAPPPPPAQDGPTVAVVMCVWRRVEFLPTTIAMLERQVGVVPELHLWVNDASAEDEVRRMVADAAIQVEVTVSPENVGGFGRFYKAREIADRHPFVVFVDDDQVFDDHAIRTFHDEAQPGAITSWYGWQFRCPHSYWERFRAQPGDWVQYAGTCGMVADSTLFNDDRLFECPERFWFVEDLWLSYVAEHLHGWTLRASAANLRQIEDGRNQWAAMPIDFKSEFLRLLVERGWSAGTRPISPGSIRQEPPRGAGCACDGAPMSAAEPKASPTPEELRSSALAAVEDGRLTDAWAYQREAIKQAFGAEWLNDLGVIADRLGLAKEAAALLVAALAIDPERDDIAENLEALRRRKSSVAEERKGRAELSFWRSRKATEGTLAHHHYQFFYTGHFGLADDFHHGLRLLDIGCGPRGSLEWADGAARRVGLDPLADSYLELGASLHAMEYVAAGAEQMPFPDASFDVVSTINSLDHVDDLGQVIAELKRVVCPGGLLLLISDVNHSPTTCEPQVFGWDIVERFAPEFDVIEERHLEQAPSTAMLDALQRPVAYDHARTEPRSGMLSVAFRRTAA